MFEYFFIMIMIMGVFFSIVSSINSRQLAAVL